MDGAAPAEEDYSKLAVEDRLEHRNWKARVSAYDELVKTFRTTISEDDRAFSPYLRDPSILRAAILDSNAVCQEKGIECACAFIEYAGRPAATRCREGFMSAIVEKSVFGVTRAGTKKATLELCLLLVECEDGADGVLEACAEGLKSKQPKAVAGAVATMKEVVRQFGVKTVNVKPVLKTIPTIFAHADKGVRAEGTQLVQELHRWLGAALDSHLADLKPVQIKELNESFANEAKGEQMRFTRAQQRDRALKEAEATLTGAAANGDVQADGADVAEDQQQEEEAALDPFELAEPTAVLDKLPNGFYDNLSSSKWKERKEEALDPLLDVLKKSPRIQDGNYDELVRALAGRMTDANVACVVSAAGCMENLAKGLRNSFAKYKQTVVPPILERCKEKKASVTDALAAALDAAFESVSISDITEDVTTLSKHKNPQVKEQTYKWLVRCLKATKVAPSLKTDLKPLTDALLHGFEDSFEPVRSAAAEGLGTLMKILGERAMGPTMEALDDIRKAKVKEFAEKAEVKYKAGPAPVAKPAGKAAAAPPARLAPKPKQPPTLSSGFDKENAPPPTDSKPAGRPPSPSKPTAPKPVAKKPPTLSSGPPARKPLQAAVPGKAAPAHKPAANEPLKYRFTQEDAEAQAETALPSEVFADLGSSNWKLRLAALENLQAWLEGEGSGTESELIVRTLSKRPGWKESNFQVYGKMAGAFQHLAEKSDNWSRACSALTIPALSDKLGDIKIKKPAGDALTAYAEKFSLQFVLSHAYEPMTKQKAPKAQADSLLWVEQALRDFGNTGIAVRDMIEFLKNGLKSSNAAVRTSATKTLVTLRLYVGPDIKTFLQDLNPTLLSTIESDFDKAGSESPPESTKLSGDNASVASTAGGAGKAAKGGTDALDDLFPRQDLDKILPNSVIAGVGDANWKQRKESLEQIQGILESNKRLKPNIGDLGTALKLRMADSNKMVQALALDIISRVASGMNKPFEKHARMFISPICTILSDAKANVRAPAITALSAIYEQCGLDCMVSSLGASLETPNPVQRKELATWIGEKLQEGTTTADLAPLAGPVITCLEDRTAEVRKAGQVLLPFVIASVGYQYVMDKTSGLKPASRSTVIPMIENAKGAAAASAAAPTAVPTSAASRPSSSASTNPPQSATSSTFASKPSIRGVSAIIRTIRPTAAPAALPQSPAVASRSNDTQATAVPARLGAVRKMPRQSMGTGVPAVVPPQDSTNEPPFRTSDPGAKQARGSRETGPLKWAIDGSARPDQVDFLQQQTIPHASSDLVTSLFSKDHHCERDFLAGLSSILECMSATTASDQYGIDYTEMKARLLANADLILKYLTVRLADTSTSMTIKCLEVVEGLFTLMLEDGYQLTDYEAGAFLPSLITKLGDGKEPIRNRVKTIIRSTGSIYPSSKTFSNLLEHGVHSKNARTRAESADELGYLFQRQGLSVCQPSKALPVIATLISDKDAACRSAALTAIAQAYSMVGDTVYKYIGSLPDKERTMLDEKLKRVGGSGSPAPATRVAPSAAGTPKRPDSRQEAATRPDSRQFAAPVSGLSRLPSAAGGIKRRQSALPMPGSHTLPSAIPSSSSSHLRESHLPQPRSILVPKTQTSSPELPFSSIPGRQRMVTDEAEPFDMNREGSLEPESPFGGVLSSDYSTSVHTLKMIQQSIMETPAELASQANQLMEAVTTQMAIAFEGLDAETPQATLRLCKHLMQTLSGFFDNKTLSLAVTREALVALLAELTKRLLETAASEASEAISSLSKVLNMVLIRIFHNVDRSSCFGALFDILQSTTIDMRELKSAELAERAKYAELVMKCLWKVSKSTKETLEDQSLDSRHLLLYIDRFLSAIPPAEWRRRASDNIPLGDMPLRTIKTILQQVVTIFGESVYEELALIDRPENSFVYQYLFRLLNNSRQASSSESTAGSEMLSRQSSTVSQVSNLMSRKQSSVSVNGSRQPSLNGHASPAPSAVMSPGRSNDIEMNMALKEIFDKIGNAQESKKGIAELYEFQKQHPEAEARINTWITATGSFFQSYLKRALSNLAAEEAERNGLSPSSLSPASRPVSTFSPAPASPATSPPLNGGSPQPPRDRASRVPSGASANDERLNSLKQMFGVPARGI